MTCDPLFTLIHLRSRSEGARKRSDRLSRACLRAGKVAQAAGITEMLVPSPGEPGASVRIVVPDPGDYGWGMAGGSSMVNVTLEPGSLQHRLYRLWLRSYRVMQEGTERWLKFERLAKDLGGVYGVLGLVIQEMERTDAQIQSLEKRSGDGLVETRPEATGGGDFEEVCSVCGEVVDLDPHTWRQCATTAATARNEWHDSWIDRVMQHEQDEDRIDALRRQIRRLQTGHEIESDYLTDHELDLQRDLDESRDQLAEAVQSLVAAQDEIEKLRAQLKGES